MSVSERLEFSVSDFVAVFNQTINYAYPSVIILGEVSNFRISRNTWLYFSLKDENSSINFFGSILKLPAPIEDGMMLRVTASPALHPKFGFSLQIQSIELSGKGTINRSQELLRSKLDQEGLFDAQRKRTLPKVPEKIGLITSSESAAYSDFIKIVNSRWGGVEIAHQEVLVQGKDSAKQIVDAIINSNLQNPELEVLVIIRGGGSSDDLETFNDEKLTRTIAGSRIPTLVAIGHERDYTFAELVADMRASTPSNAAELIVPDKKEELSRVDRDQENLNNQLFNIIQNIEKSLEQNLAAIFDQTNYLIEREISQNELKNQLLSSLNPQTILDRGYSVILKDGQSIRSSSQLLVGDEVRIRFAKGGAIAEIDKVEVK
jgi:exodeoxyribonuclease VII large subunit